MEELLRQKDTELQTLQRQARQREDEYLKLTRELQSQQFEISLKVRKSLIVYTCIIRQII